jgi:glycogen debranching enzyme
MSQEGSRLVGVRAQQQFPDPKVLEIIDFVVPRMFKAIDYLNSRDYDSDGLLEQDHNEDWMDTALRAGKIVYSQACWILALKDFSTLLLKLDHKKEAQRLTRVSQKTIQAVEQRLWSQDDEAFIDIQERHHIGRRYRTLTQDVCLYLIALTQGSRYEKSARGRIKSKRTKASRHETSKKTLSRAINTLDAIKERIWNGKWPLITEADLARTGPWILKPNVYHNHTFWPWSTGMEMIARGRFNQVRECEWLLSRVMSGKRPKMLAFYEWVDPRNGKGHGAYPFRTGISGIRIALHEMVESEVRARKSRTTSKQKHLYRAAAS